MSEIDYSICPCCGRDDETYTDSDWIWDYGYTIRACDACNITYKVYFKLVATKVEYKEDKQ
jgi:hypothetical protein